MKTINFLLVLAVITGFTSCYSDNEDSPIKNFQELCVEFVAPSKEYHPAPFYVWNTTITKEMINRTLTDLKDKGFGGVFVHARAGLITEYLSDEWYELFHYTLEQGKQLDMNTWIYDEYGYPSGFAGGHVPALMPESYNQGQSLALRKFDLLPDDTSPYFIFLKEEDGRFIDISGNLQAETGVKGVYYLFSKNYYARSPAHGGFSAVDLLIPGVTQKFIEVTMTGYERVAGDEFGRSMPGWFTDETKIQPPGGVRWTPDLFEVFEKRWGYDLKTALPSLFEETGEWKKVRHNYTETLLHLFIERWAKPCFEYCKAHNIKFTGHYMEHRWPDLANMGDNMAMNVWQQMPGIDMLFNQFDEENLHAQFGNIRLVKELSSVANQMGTRRTLSETYGGGGWEETFRDLKRLGDWQYAMGVNFMNPHHSLLSIAGARKYDYPPIFSDHSPWWPYYKTLNMHYSRLSMALSAGEQINDILVLEPTTSIWLYYAYANSNAKYRDIGQSFHHFVATLEKAQVEFDLGSESVIEHLGRVKKKNFCINRRAYRKVVLPPMMENINSKTWTLLKKFVDNGGELLVFSLPTHLDGQPNLAIEKYLAGHPNVKSFAGLTDGVIHEHFASPDITFIETKGGNFFHHRRKMADGQVLFLVNSSLDEASTGSISIKGKDAIALNTFTGELMDYPETVENNRLHITFDLPPAGSLLLYVKSANGMLSSQNINDLLSLHRPNDRKPLQSINNFLPLQNQYITIPPSSPLSVTPDGNNILTLDFCDLITDMETFRELHTVDATDKVFKMHGFSSGNPWNTYIQYKSDLVNRDTFTTGGFKAIYRFTVAGDFDMRKIQAVVERPHLYKISLNGKEIKPETGEWFLDRDMHVLPVGNAIRKGANELVLELSPMKIHAEIEPVYLTGDFSVRPVAKGFTINPPIGALVLGSWKAQGWPFYNGTVTYAKTYTVEKPSGRFQVCLSNWSGTVAAVTVNNRHAGIIAFEPYCLDVSQYIKQGENTVEVKVVGSNKNLLGPFHNNPAPGMVSPAHYRNIKTQPAGSAYEQLDYGLMDDFILVSNIK